VHVRIVASVGLKGLAFPGKPLIMVKSESEVAVREGHAASYSRFGRVCLS
jgi:hypothetical protein